MSVNKFPSMQWRGEEPINVFVINNMYIVGIYKGKISEYDIVIKYRQKEGNKWSRLRTPKHIHWTVDLLLKLQKEPDKTQEFIDILLKKWEEVEPIKSEEERKLRTNIEYIIEHYKDELDNYKELSKHGEYSVKFLVVLAELLMIQEKTNREDAYMFKKLLEALKRGESIYKIVSIAAHTGN